MNGNSEAAAGWLRKAESDLAAAALCLEAEKALDAACFHCQQAAEKSLKAWLVKRETDFPFVHDLARLLNVCVKIDPKFEQLRDFALTLTPFAVEMRYDAQFWPTAPDTAEALAAARAVHHLVKERWAVEF